jgi:hypothetical protein
MAANPLDSTSADNAQIFAAFVAVAGELETGRAAIDDQYAFAHGLLLTDHRMQQPRIPCRISEKHSERGREHPRLRVVRTAGQDHRHVFKFARLVRPRARA